MLVYWIVWTSVIILAIMAQKADYLPDGALSVERRVHTRNTRVLYILAALILIIIAGCRYNVGADFGAYYRNYTKYLDFWSDLKKLNEPGIRLIYSLAAKVINNGQFCILAASVVTLGLILFTMYRNTDGIAMALVLFMLLCWTNSFNAVRQMLAAAVLFCGFPSLRNRKFIQYLFFVFLAYLCHRSAALMLLVYFPAVRKVTPMHAIILIVLSAAVLYIYDYAFEFARFILEETINEQKEYWSGHVSIFRVLTYTAPAAYFLFEMRNREKTPEVSFYLNLLLMTAAVAVATMHSKAFGRMNMYMMPFMVISIAELMKVIESRNKQLISVAIVVLYLIVEWNDCRASTMSPFQLNWIM